MQRDNRSTKEQVLQAATRLFHERGFGGTSLNDLLAAAGVKKGSLYFHFPSKRDLALSVLERARGQFMEFLGKALQGATPEERLHRFLDRALAAHEGMGFVGGCLWGNMALETSDSDGEFADYVAGVFDAWIDRIEAVVAEGQAAGQFRKDLTARQLASHVVASVEGGIMLSRLRKDEAPFRECLDALKAMLKPAANGSATSPPRAS